MASSGAASASSARTTAVLAAQPRSAAAASFINRWNASTRRGRRSCSSNSPASFAALATTALDLCARYWPISARAAGAVGSSRSRLRASRQSSVLRACAMQTEDSRRESEDSRRESEDRIAARRAPWLLHSEAYSWLPSANLPPLEAIPDNRAFVQDHGQRIQPHTCARRRRRDAVPPDRH